MTRLTEWRGPRRANSDGRPLLRSMEESPCPGLHPDREPEMNQPLPSSVLSVRTRASRVTAAAVALLTATLLSLLTVVALAPGASAHAGLVSSDPAEGATLPSAPARVTLEFSEPVEAPAYVVATGPDGTTHQLDDPTVADAVVTQKLDPATLGSARTEGGWTIAYRIVSADGHAVQGHVRFRVSSTATVAPQPGEPASTSLPSEPSDAPSSIATPSDVASASPAPAPEAADEDEPRSSGVYVVIGAAALLAVVAAAAQVRRRTAPTDEAERPADTPGRDEP